MPEQELTAEVQCQRGNCTDPARAAVATTRTKDVIKTTVWWDNRESKGRAEQLCKKHTIMLLAELGRVLIDEG